MTQPHQRQATDSIGRQLALNIMAAMRVAGPARDDGEAAPLRSVKLQQTTGIARSTLRAIKQSAAGAEPNPDLRTLTRLAAALGIPPAFLLMRPCDWEVLCQSLDGLMETLPAAGKVCAERVPFAPDQPEKVLRACRLHPEQVPQDAAGGGPDLQRLRDRNEYRRRTSHVLGALMLRAADIKYPRRVAMTALAAALTNQITPHDPQASLGAALSEKER